VYVSLWLIPKSIGLVPNKFPPKCLPLCKKKSSKCEALVPYQTKSFGLFRLKKPPQIVDMSANGQLVFTDVDKVTFKGVGNASNAVIDTLTGKIGVGIDSPSANLHVVGNCFVSTNFELGGTMTMGTVTVEAQHELSAITATGNLTPHTIQFTNPTTAFTTTGNVEVGKDLTVTGFVGNSGTGAILVPSGTTAQQPAGVNGMLRYNTETGYMEAYTASGWSVIATPPSITSFDTLNVAVVDVNTDTITVSGSGFDAITNIQLRGADGKNYDTTTFTFTDSGSIGFKMGTLALGQLANRPFKVVATNGAGLSATSSTTLGLGGVTWLSPAASSINEFAIGAATTLTLSASDGGGGSAVTYTLQSGSYLSGTFTLSGSTITGTTDAAENTTSSVTIRATDNADSSVFLDRTFTLKAVPDGLFPFSSFTFTNAGVVGRDGPYLTDFLAAYSPTWTDNSAYFTATNTNTDRGVQIWTAPKTGTYIIKAAGARGGNSYDIPTNSPYGAGLGAYSQGRISLTKGTKFAIIVGQAGGDVAGPASAGEYNAGGGGGASWFLSEDRTTVYAVGAGGGGANARRWGSTGASNGGTSQGNTTTNGGAPGSGTYGGGGSGFASAGSGGGGNSTGGGWIRATTDTARGGDGFGTNAHGDGGFGGGGGSYYGGGGGAGYAGGGGIDYYSSPGGLGGSSYHLDTVYRSFNTHTGQHGFVYIEFVS
jgi:hypothetical protein